MHAFGHQCSPRRSHLELQEALQIYAEVQEELREHRALFERPIPLAQRWARIWEAQRRSCGCARCEHNIARLSAAVDALIEQKLDEDDV